MGHQKIIPINLEKSMLQKNNKNFRVAINMAMTLDGKSILADGQWHSLTSMADRNKMDIIREGADVIFAGAASLRQDNAKLYVRNNTNAHHPIPVIFTKSGKLSQTLHLFQKPHPKPVIVCSKQAQKKIAATLKKTDYQNYTWAGWHELIDLIEWLSLQYNAKIFLLEGGPKLNAFFFQQDLITDMYITIVPFIAGGKGSGPVQYTNQNHSEKKIMKIFQQKAQIVSCQKIENEVFLHYSFCH